MTRATREMLAKALKLPPRARAELAEGLLASLATESEAVDQEWRELVARRVEEYLADRNPGRPLDEVAARIRGKRRT